MKVIENFFQKNQKIFQKPLDKSKIYAIIEVQKKENNRKCWVISKENWERTVQWTTKLEADGVGKVPQGRGERKKERRVQKAMIPSHDEAKAWKVTKHNQIEYDTRKAWPWNDRSGRQSKRRKALWFV